MFQATDSYTVQLEEGTPFTFDSGTKTLHAPAEGGIADLWLTFSSPLSAVVPEAADWLRAAILPEDGFYRLKVRVDPVEGAEGRESRVVLYLQSVTVPIGEIKVIQAGSVTGE